LNVKFFWSNIQLGWGVACWVREYFLSDLAFLKW